MRASSSSDSQWLSNAGPAVGQQEVGVVIQTARGGDLRLQHAQRAGRGVARIGEAGQAALVALGVQTLEGAAVHDRLAADFESRRACDFTRSGSERMVRAFSVTSSPTMPSPRVTAWTNWPSR